MDKQTTSASVEIVGRLGAHVRTRELPSGDVITTFTLVVDRPERELRGTTRVDAITCVATKARIRTALERWEPGTLISASGVLRRRFWRAGSANSGSSGMGSATEVLVRSARKVASL